MNLAEELKARGLIEHSSAPAETILGTKRTAYIGADPTADSLHVGHLAWIMLLRRLADAGHDIVLLIGGGTGMIGDPKEKGERILLDMKTVAKNATALKTQLQSILGKTKVRMVNNADWLLKTNLIEFLRDTGKYFTVNDLIKRDTIKRRLETPDESISYTEFTYALLQGFDYYVLNKKYGVDLQVGGSDQWTNLLSGVDLIRKRDSKEAFALTIPLVTDSSGKKFGKSEGNAVWLDTKKTSPFAFYQFWLNQPDDMVGAYLKMYTFMPLSEIESLLEKHTGNPGAREAQKALAHAVTELVHGKTATESAEKAAAVLFGGMALSDLSPEARKMLITDAPSVQVSKSDIAKGLTVLDVLATSTLVTSKSEARRLIEGKGISLNGLAVTVEQMVTEQDFVQGLALLKKGKRELVILVLK